MIIYATVADLAAWLDDEPPANATSLLRSASLLVTDAMACDYYGVDADNAPTDTLRIAAARDAVCAQAQTWAALGIDPAAGAAGAGRTLTSSKILDASVTYATTSRNTDDRANAAGYLCDQALLILRQAGVALGKPWTL